MIDCELFESRYKIWNSGTLSDEIGEQMVQHHTYCSHCQSLTSDLEDVRMILGSLRKHEPSPRFDYRLKNRIDEYEKKRSQPASGRSIIPRWAAMGAGIATGLAIGLAVLIPLKQGGIDPISTPGEMTIASARKPADMDRDSLNIGSDSLSKEQKGYNPDRLSQTVSTGE